MKKIIGLVVCVILMLLMFAGCGNMAIIDPGNYSYRHVHFSDKVEGYCATVEKWHDNDSGIEVKTREFGSLFLSEGTYILFEDDCPYCS